MNRTVPTGQSPLIKKLFLSMLLPTILMNLTTALASMADTMIIGHYLDDLSLSVVTFVTPIYMAINLFSALFSMGGCVSMGIAAGQGNTVGARRAFSMAMELLMAVGLLFTLCGVFFIEPVTRALGAGEDVFALVRSYARIILLGTPLFMLSTGLAFFVRNDGRAKLCMAAMFSSIAVDITLNFVFVGRLGWGVAGAAYSTVLGNVAAIGLMSAHFFSKKNTLRFAPAMDKSVLRLLSNGGSAALHFVWQFVTILFINRLLSSMAGTDGVVVYTVVFNLSLVSLSVFEGISQTLQPMVSVFCGEGSNRSIRITMKLVLWAVFIICGSVVLLLELFPAAVPLAFGLDSAALVEKASFAVRIYAVSMVITTLNVVAGYYLQSMEHSSAASLLVSLRSFLLFIPALILLGRSFGINGIWASYTLAELLSSLCLLFLLRSKRQKFSAQGIDAGLMLLDRRGDAASFAVGYDCRRDKPEDFMARLAALREESPLCGDMGSLLDRFLLRFFDGLPCDKGRYLEVEYLAAADRLILRHDFECDAEGLILPTESGPVRMEYAPVLGLNRFCLEKGE